MSPITADQWSAQIENLKDGNINFQINDIAPKDVFVIFIEAFPLMEIPRRRYLHLINHYKRGSVEYFSMQEIIRKILNDVFDEKDCIIVCPYTYYQTMIFNAAINRKVPRNVKLITSTEKEDVRAAIMSAATCLEYKEVFNFAEKKFELI